MVVRNGHGNTIWLLFSRNTLSYAKIIICFTLDCKRQNFFGHGEVHNFQTLLWDFNLGSKFHIHVSTAIIYVKKFSPPLLNHFKCSRSILRRVRFCMSVNASGTHHTATFFLNKCSVKIWWTVVHNMPVSAYISLTITCDPCWILWQ